MQVSEAGFDCSTKTVGFTQRDHKTREILNSRNLLTLVQVVLTNPVRRRREPKIAQESVGQRVVEDMSEEVGALF